VFPKQKSNLRLSDHRVEPYALSQVALCVTVTVTVTVNLTAQLGLEGTVLPSDQGDAGSIPAWGTFWKTNCDFDCDCTTWRKGKRREGSSSSSYHLCYQPPDQKEIGAE
jgi:hypothetical protein